jgi:hypothetical protein
MPDVGDSAARSERAAVVAAHTRMKLNLRLFGMALAGEHQGINDGGALADVAFP